jgi:hypothetical protein
MFRYSLINDIVKVCVLHLLRCHIVENIKGIHVWSHVTCCCKIAVNNTMLVTAVWLFWGHMATCIKLHMTSNLDSNIITISPQNYLHLIKSNHPYIFNSYLFACSNKGAFCLKSLSWEILYWWSTWRMEYTNHIAVKITVRQAGNNRDLLTSKRAYKPHSDTQVSQNIRRIHGSAVSFWVPVEMLCTSIPQKFQCDM